MNVPSSNRRSTFTISLHAEKFRMVTYVVFWTLMVIAREVSELLVVGNLEMGVDKSAVPQEKWGCGAFGRKGGDFNLTYGEGFDFHNESHLNEYIGFNNVCINWDYEPARQIVAVFEAIWEYTLSAYLFMDFVGIFLNARRGKLPKWFWNLSKIVYPLLLFCGAMFRMTMVVIAYENVKMHTAGFLCIQVVLLSVAISNTMQVFMLKLSYPRFYMNLARTQMWTKIYIFSNLFISFFKVTGTIEIVLTGFPPAYYNIPLTDKYMLGQLVDHIWMFFNAFFPFFIAYVRNSSDDPVVFTLNLPGDGDEQDNQDTETTSLIHR